MALAAVMACASIWANGAQAIGASPSQVPLPVPSAAGASQPMAPLPSFALPADSELSADATLQTTDQPATVDSVSTADAENQGFALADALPDAQWTLSGVEATLNDDPFAAFAFVRDRIGFEPYDGVLRGAAGTLAARSGNALDRAVLLKTLLDSMFVTSRFATAELDDATAGQILATAFASPVNPLQSAGVAEVEPLDPNAILTRAKRDNALLVGALGDRLASLPSAPADPSLELTRHHAWVQLAWGATWLDLDPSLPQDQPGTALTSASATYVTLPDEFYQHVSVEVSAAEANGGPLQDQVVLTRTLDTPTAADSRIFLYFQPDLSGTGSVIVQSLTGIQRFVPQLVVNGDSEKGTPFVVNDSGRDLFGTATSTGEQLARLTLSVTRTAPHEASETVESVLLDRVPPALRDASTLPADQLVPFTGNAGGVAQLQVLRHILISAGGSNAYGHAVERGASASFAGNSLSDANKAAGYQLTDQLWPLAVADELLPLASEGILGTITAGSDARALVARPRVFIVSVSPQATADSDPSKPRLRLTTDLLLDDMRVIAPATVDPATVTRVAVWYGAVESALETEFNLRLARMADPSTLQLFGTSLAMPGATLTVVDAATAPADAPEALTEELANGGLAVVPGDAASGVWWTVGSGGETKAVLDPGLGGGGFGAGPHDYTNEVGGQVRWVIDPKTGETLGYIKDGTYYKYVYKPKPAPSQCTAASEESTNLSCISVPGAWAIGIIVGELTLFCVIVAVMVLTN
jgi:hypothetical protein